LIVFTIAGAAGVASNSHKVSTAASNAGSAETDPPGGSSGGVHSELVAGRLG